MNTLTTTTMLGDSLAWALLYSLWQGLIIYGCLFALLKAMPGINPKVKYLAGTGAFTALFLWFADTWVEQYENLKGAVVYITNPQALDMPGTYTISATAAGAEHGFTWHSLLSQAEPYFPVIMLLYMMGLSFMIARFVLNLWQVQALRTRGVYAADRRWTNFITAGQTALHISRPVKLLISTKVNVPLMMGVLKPVILLPVAAINNLTTEQAEAILLHELAHIKRHDYLVNMLQTVGETILFFNPFVWLISSVIRREREHCCDDMAVAHAGNPLPYASALAMLESSRRQGNELALAATGNKYHLLNRIKRIMEMKRNKPGYGQLAIILAAIVAIPFMIAMFTFTSSFAQKSKKTTATHDSTKTPTYHYKTVTTDGDGNTNEEKTSDKPVTDADTTYANGRKSRTITRTYTNTSTGGDKEGIVDIDENTNEVTITSRNVSKEVQEAMASVRQELNDIDWDKIFADIDRGIEEVNRELGNPRLQRRIRKELERSRAAMEDARRHVEEQMRKVKEEWGANDKHRGHSHSYYYSYGKGQSAVPPTPPMSPMSPMSPMPPLPPMSHSLSTNSYETMLDKMEQAGLIDKSAGYKVRKENGQLYINDKLQPEDVYQRYSPYMKNKNIAIVGSKDNINIAASN